MPRIANHNHHKDFYQKRQLPQRNLRDAKQTLMKIVPSIPAYLPPPTIRRNHCTIHKFKTSTVYAKKVDGSPDISSRTKNSSTLLQYKKLRLTNYTLAKLALTIFGLGFIDAG